MLAERLKPGGEVTIATDQDVDLKLDVLSDKVDEMPNVILKGDCDRKDVLSDVETQVWQETHRDVSVVIKLMEVYEHLNDGHRLVGLMVREGELAQYFGVSILFRKEDELLIKLAAIGQPRPTWGVKQAVKKVADLILKNHSGLQLVSTTVG